MRHAEAIAWLYGLAPRGMRFELTRMRRALALRGNPHRGLRFVHVAGTNGKGSVSATLERVLREAGYRTGLYTSPHLHHFGERIRVLGEPLSPRDTAQRLTSLRAMLDSPGAPELTFFEVATLLAFEVFRDAGCDVVVLEVGLGGRLDATNVVTPELAIVTHVARDHMQYLGETIEKIAREKGGIIKARVPVVLGRQERAARDVLVGIARRKHAKVVQARSSMLPVGVLLALAGAHQRDNAACVVAAVRVLAERGFRLPDAALRVALARVEWPGRLETVKGHPSFLLDAAHNPDGARALAAHLAARTPREKCVLLFGAMRDKEHDAMLAAFDGLVADRVYLAPKTPRAASTEQLAAVRPGVRARSVGDAIARAKRLAGPRGLVVVAGSIFVLAEVRARLLGVRAEPVIAL